jgi:hypothetical protein
MGIVDNALMGASGQSGYNLTRSLRTRASASANLTRTPASSSNQKTWTFSAWVKRGQLGTVQNILTARYPTASWFILGFQSDDTITVAVTAGSSVGSYTSAVFRDPAAWYHIVLAFDSTQATAANRTKLYVNAVQQTFAFTNYPTLNTDYQINQNVQHTLSGYSGQYFDGYMTEINFIDGQALTPSSFGSTNTITGVWQPKKYAGTYGTNGFYLPFTDNSALTTSSNVGLGKDFSGNGNYWTTNNISITAGATYDSMTDVPTLTSTTAANYCVLNPLSYDTNTYTLSNANLTFAGARTATGTYYARSTMAVSSGKWYWEVVPTDVGSGPNIIVGIQDASTTATTAGANLLLNGYGYGADGYKNNNAGQTAGYGATWTNGDVIGIALDLDGGTITFYKNNASQGVAYSSITGTYCPVVSMSTGGVARTVAGSINFGQRPFTYTAPTGFLPLNTYNI